MVASYRVACSLLLHAVQCLPNMPPRWHTMLRTNTHCEQCSVATVALSRCGTRVAAAQPVCPSGLVLATLTTNIAANVVAPANALVNAAPRTLTFTLGGVITALLGMATMPWKLYGSFLNFLVAYSVLLGPVVGVVMTDYYIVRGRVLDVDALFSSSPKGAYWYQVTLCVCAQCNMP